MFSPLENPAIRIVYIYRNPLDQCVSFFRHTRKHRRDSTRTVIEGDGTETEIADERDYLRRVGIEAYVKQHCESDSRRRRLRRTLHDVHERVSAGVHAEVTAIEARSLFLTVYLLLGEIALLEEGISTD